MEDDMKFAIVDGIRALPQPKTTGMCPICDNKLISKCGNKLIWHWSHVSIKHCDSWWEPETQWHRNWKDNYPQEWQEIVQYDINTGEKHIADIKTPSGLVLEFQNSPMSFEELKQRESFYGNMIWVVNGSHFRDNFHIFHLLPDPECELVKDIYFISVEYNPKYNNQGGCFWIKSENDYDPKHPTLVRVHSINEIMDDIQANYIGHHLFDWIRPRTVWFNSSVDVYFDFGDSCLWKFQQYDDRGLPCVQAVSKIGFFKRTTTLS